MADVRFVRLVAPSGVTVRVREDMVDRLPPGFTPVAAQSGETPKATRTTKAAAKAAAPTE